MLFDFQFYNVFIAYEALKMCFAKVKKNISKLKTQFELNNIALDVEHLAYKEIYIFEI